MPEIIVKLGDNVIQSYYFDKDVISVGRARDNDIVIENLAVSRNHVRIRRENGAYVLTDLNSANGTYVNGVRVNKTEVMNDDVVTVGKHYLHFINKQMSDEQVISDAFGAERTMIVEKVANATLTITKGKQKDEQFQVTKYETYIGRASDNDIRLHDWFVSKKHALIVRQGQKFLIRDLGSWRGTLVNGKQIKDSDLKNGDILTFGTTQLEFKLQDDTTPLLEGRKPEEMIDDEMPAIPVEAGGNGSDPQIPEELSQTTGDRFAREIAMTPPGGPEPAVEEPITDISEEEFVLEEEEEYIAPEPEEDIIFVDEDDKEPLDDSEKEQDIAIQTPRPSDERDQYVEQVLSDEVEQAVESKTSSAIDQDKFEEAVEALESGEVDLEIEEEPADKDAERAPEEQVSEEVAQVVARQPEYEVPEGLSPDVDTKLVKMWLRALTNKSKVVRKQAAKQLKKLTGISYDWE